MSYIAHEETYKDHDIKIETDDDPQDPREWDNLGTMVCFHSRYTLGDAHDHKTGQALILALVQEVTVEDKKVFGWWIDELDGWAYYNNLESLDDGEKILEKLLEIVHEHYIVLPLNLYDHSGISMSTSSFVGRAHHAEWDSGQVGWIYISKEDAKKEYGWKVLTAKRRALVEKYLTGEVEVYDAFLRGNVYGYTIEGELSDDSCWGFYPEGKNGYDYCLTEAKSIIDYEVSQKEIADAHAEIEASESSWSKLARIPEGAA